MGAPRVADWWKRPSSLPAGPVKITSGMVLPFARAIRRSLASLARRNFLGSSTSQMELNRLPSGAAIR